MVYIFSYLYKKIIKEFQDTTFLFGHGGKPYNRISTTTRISTLSKIELGKPASAHMLRHSFITEALKKGVAIEKVSRYVGHSSLDITEKQYNHNGFTFDDFKDVMA